ncbi:NAD(P)-dependent oxidoreductase [Bacillus solimangrovi]|uniref:NAD(P)-binding domain-containing protein n=1 Tax=Bacillus solimangrovi TaxID=1305675 RepID=A0A1E5LFW2_9BACI|nr:NAD(P)H-binding protein [Bacillus solimangrovi]OEH92946.1 hypothetical protein BFG57_14325 [Bacillus solimangrovi]
MKVCLLGATGRTGQVILETAIKDNLEVHALIRSPEKIPFKNPKLTLFKGNALSLPDLKNAMNGCEVVVSALNTDGNNTISKSMPLIVQAMLEEGIKRIITIGTAGILNSRYEHGKLRYESKESKRKSTRAAEDHHKGFNVLHRSTLNWTIVCPTYLPDGELIGTCRAEKNLLPLNGSKIHVADTALFAYNQIYNNNYLRTRVGIAY